MRDPYEVLGVPRGSDNDRVKAAYRELAKKYHPDNYVGTPLAEVANEKMQEINEAYDAIISGNAGGSYRTADYTYTSFAEVENLIRQNRLDEAEQLLESYTDSERNAYWYYLKGQVNDMRGWTQQAYSYYSMAHNMDPSNRQYEAAYRKMETDRSGGFRTRQRHTERNGESCCDPCDVCDCCDCGDSSGCDICTGLLCADCCCECFGGDLISCC